MYEGHPGYLELYMGWMFLCLLLLNLVCCLVLIFYLFWPCARSMVRGPEAEHVFVFDMDSENQPNNIRMWDVEQDAANDIVSAM